MAQKRNLRAKSIQLVEFSETQDSASRHFAADTARGGNVGTTPISSSDHSSSLPDGHFAGTPAKQVFDLCLRLQQDPGQFETLFPQIKKACMVFTQAAPSFGPLILNLGYHLSRFDYAAAVERAHTLMHYEDAVLEARGQAALERVFDELANFGRYH